MRAKLLNITKPSCTRSPQPVLGNVTVENCPTSQAVVTPVLPVMSFLSMEGPATPIAAEGTGAFFKPEGSP